MNTYIVNESSNNIRTLARQILNGHWKSAAVAMVIFTVCITVPTIIIMALFGGFSEEALMSEELMAPGEGLSTIYSVLVSGAFTFGISVYFLDLVREKKADLGQVFSGFGFFFKTLLLYLAMCLFILLWSLLLIVPGIIAAFAYSQAFFILADDPSKGVMQCLKESKTMMKGNKAKYFCLEVSFIGWYLLIFAAYMIIVVAGAVLTIVMSEAALFVVLGIGILVLLIGMMILTPYVMAATTVFYEMVNGNLRPQSAELPPLSQAAPELKVYNNNDSVNNDKIEL